MLLASRVRYLMFTSQSASTKVQLVCIFSEIGENDIADDCELRRVERSTRVFHSQTIKILGIITNINTK